MYLKILTFISLLFIVACSSGQLKSPASEGSKSAFSYYYDAIARVEAGEFESALANLDSAIALRPSVANFYQVKGWVYTQLNQPDSAIQAYKKCLRLKSHFPEVWISIGKLYMTVKRYDQAAFYLRKAVQAYPDSSAFHLLLAESYYQNERYHLALDFLRFYKKLKPVPEADYWKWLGLTHYQMGNYQSAIVELTTYLSRKGDDPIVLKFLGFSKFAVQEWDEAISYLNRAVEYLPGDPEIYLYRARYFINMKKPDIAMEQLQVGLTYDSTNAELLYQIAVMYYESEKFEEAKQHLLKIIRWHPQFWNAYRYLGFLAEREANYSRAYEYYKTYIDNTFVNDPEVNDRIKKLSNMQKK